jgi:transposase-like protein
MIMENEKTNERGEQPQEKKIGLKIKDMQIELKDTPSNRKTLSVIARKLTFVESGTPVFTFQAIADQLGYAARQNTNNFSREFEACGEDFQQFSVRQNLMKGERFPLIEAQILASPFLSLHKHYLCFTLQHPDLSISEPTFRDYVKEIDSTKLVKRCRQLVSASGEKVSVDTRHYIKELLQLAHFPATKTKEIVELFPEVQTDKLVTSSAKPIALSHPAIEKKLLVLLLYVCNVSQEMLALLFGVGKTSVHNWIYAVGSEELTWLILSAITCWSGKVSFDEKWIRLNGRWHFALCAVDMVTGFPLLIELYPTLNEDNWTLFFLHFKRLYGLPTLIISAGSRSLAAARKRVFKHVRCQLCKFHKLKNLMKRIRVHVQDAKTRIRGFRLAKHIFSNTSVSSRKYAAKTLQKLAGKQVSAYIDGHILTCWRKLTMSLTNNASERFNRKIEKCFSGRYGIPSLESAAVLLRGLWLKELLLNGQKHLDATSQLRSLDVSTICQEHLDTSQILHVFHDDDPSRIEKLG